MLFVIFPLLTFNILFLPLIFVSLIILCPSWVSPAWDSLCSLDLVDYFLSHVREVFPIISSNIFLGPFSLSTPSGPPITRMFCAFNVVPEVS